MNGLDFIHEMWNAGLTFGGGIMMFVLKRIIAQLDENTKAIADHRVEDAGKYVTNTQMKEYLDRLHGRVDGVDKKTDKILEILLDR